MVYSSRNNEEEECSDENGKIRIESTTIVHSREADVLDLHLLLKPIMCYYSPNQEKNVERP